jgi:predicted RNase H-like nuclease (RuvC/YqgF family)
MSGDNLHAPMDWGMKGDEMTLEYRCSNCGTVLATTNADPLHDEIERLRADNGELSHARQRYLTELDKAEAEIERLKKACRDQAGVELSEENDRQAHHIGVLTGELNQAEEKIERLTAALEAIAQGNWNRPEAGLLNVHQFARRALEEK